ncbi:MAG: hypothetical protein AABZ20_11980 [candidate division NC10 bacterium]
MATSAPVGVNASIVGENPTGLGIYSVNLARALDQVRDDLIVYTSYPKALGGLRARLARAPAVVRPGRGLVVRTQPHLHLLALQCDENTRIVNARRFPAAP